MYSVCVCVCVCFLRDLGNGMLYRCAPFVIMKSFSCRVAQTAWRVPYSNAKWWNMPFAFLLGFQRMAFQITPTMLAVSITCNSDLLKTTPSTCTVAIKAASPTSECICVDCVGFSRRFCWFFETSYFVMPKRKCPALTCTSSSNWYKCILTSIFYVNILVMYSWQSFGLYE